MDRMSGSGSQAGSSDALNSLLNDLGGVEGNIFGRPKTLGGMKKVHEPLSRGMAATKTPSKPSSGAAFQASASTPSQSQQQPFGGSASHSVDQLENMMNQSAHKSAASAR